VVSNHGLSTSQQLAASSSLAKLKLNESLPNISIWGKIAGGQKDYFVAQSISVTTSIVKTNYFSGDGCITFSKLPPVDDWLRERCIKIRGAFTGNPSRKYRDGRIYTLEEEEEEEAKDREEEEAKAEDEENQDPSEPKVERKKERRINEIDRLAYTVEAIDNQCSLVPRGSYYLTATGSIVKNDAFRGITIDDAKKLVSYQLFRSANDSKTMARIRRAGVANNYDFLDTLTDSIKREWSLSVDDSGTVVTLRSLIWLGFEFTITSTTSTWSSGYFGAGQRNLDLPFML